MQRIRKQIDRKRSCNSHKWHHEKEREIKERKTFFSFSLLDLSNVSLDSNLASLQRGRKERKEVNNNNYTTKYFEPIRPSDLRLLYSAHRMQRRVSSAKPSLQPAIASPLTPQSQTIQEFGSRMWSRERAREGGREGGRDHQMVFPKPSLSPLFPLRHATVRPSLLLHLQPLWQALNSCYTAPTSYNNNSAAFFLAGIDFPNLQDGSLASHHSGHYH